jgi:hypothetical protein
MIFTPKDNFLSQGTYLDLEITTKGPLENVLMTDQFLFNSYVDPETKQTIYNIYQLSGISQYLSNLEDLKKYIESKQINKESPQPLTMVKSLDKLLVLGFSDGNIIFFDFESQVQKVIEKVHNNVISIGNNIFRVSQYSASISTTPLSFLPYNQCRRRN